MERLLCITELVVPPATTISWWICLCCWPQRPLYWCQGTGSKGMYLRRTTSCPKRNGFTNISTDLGSCSIY
ncbi:hypothetical protein BJX96DRAFT_53691 [Aspergillus floccosus]